MTAWNAIAGELDPRVGPLVARLRRIAEAHVRYPLVAGLSNGCCGECDLRWPCPTYVWATTERDATLDTWDPGDGGSGS